MSAKAVEDFREFFRGVTLEQLKLMAVDDEVRDDYAAMCWATFELFGDPRCWVGFDELPELVKYALNGSYREWPGPREPLVIPDGLPVN